MDTFSAVKIAARDADMSLRALCRALGKSDNYIANNASRGSDPSARNAAAMFEACGYRLAAVPFRDVPPSALVIDPPDAV